MSETKLGKIEKVHFGVGGYQDAMIGFNFTLTGAAWGVNTVWRGHWISDPSPDAKWTNETRVVELGEAMMELGTLLQDAKVTDVYKLVGVPIEATFDGMILKDWRILKEVL